MDKIQIFTFLFAVFLLFVRTVAIFAFRKSELTKNDILRGGDCTSKELREKGGYEAFVRNKYIPYIKYLEWAAAFCLLMFTVSLVLALLGQN